MSTSTMQVVPVDERDSSREDDAPRFRVYFHTTDGETTLGATDTYDVTGATVLQVLDWAHQAAGDRLTYAVALVRDDVRHPVLEPEPRRGLVWLVGIDGNDTTEGDPTAYAAQQGMLARRGQAVVVPDGDRAPSGFPTPYGAEG